MHISELDVSLLEIETLLLWEHAQQLRSLPMIKRHNKYFAPSPHFGYDSFLYRAEKIEGTDLRI